eukprot:6471581-Amphidinium_carterae.1
MLVPTVQDIKTIKRGLREVMGLVRENYAVVNEILEEKCPELNLMLVGKLCNFYETCLTLCSSMLSLAACCLATEYTILVERALEGIEAQMSFPQAWSPDWLNFLINV